MLAIFYTGLLSESSELTPEAVMFTMSGTFEF